MLLFRSREARRRRSAGRRGSDSDMSGKHKWLFSNNLLFIGFFC